MARIADQLIVSRSRLGKPSRGFSFQGLKVFQYSLAIFLAFLWVIPLLWVVLVSLKPDGSNVVYAFSWLSPPFTLHNYEEVLSSQAPLWVLNSLLIALVSTSVVLFLSTLCAYPFARGRFPGRNILFALVAAGLMVPVEATLIPLYVLFRSFNMMDSLVSVILPGLAAPFGVLVMKQFIQGLPQELFDAAKIDGCNTMRIIYLIVIPLSRPAMAALGIFTFLGSWNNFLWPYISLSSPALMTVPVGVPFFSSEFGLNISLPMAANVILSIPVIVIFLFFQRYIVKGISFTGLK